MKKFLKIAAAASTAAFIAACGGGGGDSAPVSTSPPQGVYTGTLTGSTSTAFQLLALENGEFYSMYGINSGPVFGVAGFIQGTGSANGSTFTSSNVKDFGVTPAVAGSLTSTFSDSSISGSVTASGRTINFNGTRPTASTYDYNAAPSIAAIVGTWTLSSPDATTVTLNIAANGSFTGSGSGCTFSGTLTPRSSGKNVLNVSLTFGAAPCDPAGGSASGIALSYPLSNGQRQLILAGTNASRTDGVALFGAR
jgi:hypothetical protein